MCTTPQQATYWVLRGTTMLVNLSYFSSQVLMMFLIISLRLLSREKGSLGDSHQ